MINEEQEIQKVVENLIKDCKTYSENENRLNEEGVQQLNEDLWEKIKYGLSKLGRYKAGGKIRGKKKIDAAAAEQIKAIVDKKGNEMIKGLDAKIKETNPKFPNNEKQEDFLKTIMEISAVYDSIVAASKLGSKQKGFLPDEIANDLIEDLAVYVKKFLDVDLAAVYSTMDESVIQSKGGAAAAAKGTSPEDAAAAAGKTPTAKKPDAADATRQKLQGKTADDAETRDSQRMQTLKSNKLPLVLAGVGTALGALGWLAQTEWMSTVLENMFGGNTPGVDAVTQTIDGGAADSQGMVHWMSEINSASGAGEIQNLGDIGEFIQTHGAENVSHMFDGNGSALSSMEQVEALQKFAANAPNESITDIFQKGHYVSDIMGSGDPSATEIFGDMKAGRNTFGISKAGKFVSTIIVKQAVKAGIGAGVGVAASVAGIGSILLPLGIGLIATGGLVKLMRMKGQKQSRAKTLNDLFQSIQQVEGGAGATDDEIPEFDIDKLYIIIIRFLKYILIFNPTPEPVKPDPVKPEPWKKPDEDPRYKVRQNPDQNDYGHGPGNFDQSTWDEGYELKEAVELEEGRYLKDPNTLAKLNKLIGNEDTTKKFEGFLTKLVVMRNAVKRMPSKATGDLKIDGKVEKLKANPMMRANIGSLVKIDPEDPNSINELKDFIIEVVKIVESGKAKYANVLSKLNEGVDIMEARPKAAAMGREEFKKALLPFIGEIVTLYRHVKSYKNRAGKQPIKEDAVRLNGLNEQIEKMKHLMKF